MELPYILVQTVLFVCISYFMVGGLEQSPTCMPAGSMQRRRRWWLPGPQQCCRCRAACCLPAFTACPSCRHQVGFVVSSEEFFYYGAMFMTTLWFYNVFGCFVVYITPNQQLAQVC